MNFHRCIIIGIIFLTIGVSWWGSTWLSAGSALAGDGSFEENLPALGAQSRNQIIAAIKALGQIGDAAALPALEALRDDRLRVNPEGRVLILSEDGRTATDALTGQQSPGDQPGLEAPVINNQVRRELNPTIAKLRLASPRTEVRLAAAKELAKGAQPDAIETIRSALNKETDARIREILTLALAVTELKGADLKRRLAAIDSMAKSGQPDFIQILRPLTQKGESGNFLELEAPVRTAAAAAIVRIENRLALINGLQNIFYGISLGSVLLLIALGLAITFGLMGVINMAHGEMLMLGAYSTYVIQLLFKAYCPAYLAWYPVAAIPTAFLVSALVGAILEISIIRHLYGRPLETLLSTWGISLLLIQAVRVIFGAQNVEVANPSWLSGGIEVTQGLVFTYNRIAIIIFVVFVVTSIWLLLSRTRLGLRVRAVIQNRGMAASMGILTSRVDTWTFALGSGLAGLGGVALSQIGNVGPELGQAYIVDSFMVVVLGGVGKIAGTVCGALGLGIVNKLLEPFSGAVLGKIMVLVFIILFIQKRPQGLFALKGRQVEG